MSDNKFVIIVGEECPHCGEAKRLLEDKINSGRVKVLDYDSEEGSKLVSKYGINEVPTIIHNNRTCQLSLDGKTLFCGKEEIKI